MAAVKDTSPESCLKEPDFHKAIALMKQGAERLKDVSVSLEAMDKDAALAFWGLAEWLETVAKELKR